MKFISQYSLFLSSSSSLASFVWENITVVSEDYTIAVIVSQNWRLYFQLRQLLSALS